MTAITADFFREAKSTKPDRWWHNPGWLSLIVAVLALLLQLMNRLDPVSSDRGYDLLVTTYYDTSYPSDDSYGYF